MATSSVLLRSTGSNGFQLTPEQEEIIADGPDQTRIIEAFAGCAKTTTLAEYAKVWKQRGLYIAFNTSIANEANGKFPSHIEARTAHSYAHRQMGVSRYQDRLKQKLWPNDLNGCIDLMRPMPNMTEIAIRRALLATLNNFLISSDAHVGPQHLKGFPRQAYELALPMATAVIERIMDYPNSNMPFTHDVYFKDFARAGQFATNLEYLLLDEAQDSNDVLIGAASRAGVPMLIVGDHWQSIYAFRGSTNAMEVFEGRRYPLSLSFRFGPAVAAVANHILSFSTKPPANRIYGNINKTTRVLEYRGALRQACTILARTNMRLFEGIVKIVDSASREGGSDKGIKFHVVGAKPGGSGGLDEMLTQAEAGYELSVGLRPTKHDALISRFATWSELKEAAEAEDDPDLSRLVKIVDTYGERIPELIVEIRKRHVNNEKDAAIILATAHKAKGREWRNVVIMDDFVTIFELTNKLQRKRIDPIDYDQEINLLYVAMTRATEQLLISPVLYEDVAGGAGLPRSY